MTDNQIYDLLLIEILEKLSSNPDGYANATLHSMLTKGYSNNIDIIWNRAITFLNNNEYILRFHYLDENTNETVNSLRITNKGINYFNTLT